MPLGNALSANDSAKTRILVKEGADINGWNKRGSSWLHSAIQQSRDEFARFLLRHGAVNRDQSGHSRSVEPWMLGWKTACPWVVHLLSFRSEESRAARTMCRTS